MKITHIYSVLGVMSASIVLAGCKAGGEDQGLEYAPQMYHSVAYEPLSQITEESEGTWLSTREDEKGEYFNSNINNPHNMNMREPAANTVPRNQQGYLPYRLKAFELEEAALIESPMEASDEVIAEGQQLYTQFCSTCHGAGGEGDGLAGQKIGGVANLKGGAYLNLPEGHIFHVITKGKGRMAAHGSQIPAESRWKIVHYVKQEIQGGAGTAQEATEETAEETAEASEETQTETPEN